MMLLGLLAACGGNGSYRDDVSIDELAAAVDAAIADSGAMIEAPDNYISGTMQMPVSEYDGYCIKLNSMGVNIDEYGIFKGKDSEQVQEIKKAAEEYLRWYMEERWMPEYMPQEYPKLENAEVKVAGNYVMYAILSDSTRASAFEVFQNALAK